MSDELCKMKFEREETDTSEAGIKDMCPMDNIVQIVNLFGN